MKESELCLKDKTTQHSFSYFQIARKPFMTDPLNIISDYFSI